MNSIDSSSQPEPRGIDQGVATSADVEAHSASSQVPIAIVGMACRLPGRCATPRDLWEFMRDGGVADTKPPSTRFNLKGHYDASQKPNTMKTPGAMFMETVDPADFDAPFFNINYTDASSMDPQQRVLLEVSYECLENAGITLEKIDSTRLGCIVGASAVDYQDMDSRDPEDRTGSPTVGLCRTLLSNRISHFLNVHGPSFTLDTACSSGITALKMACLCLQSGEAEAMLVGSVNMYLSPERNQDMGAMRPTASPTGRCYAFDSRADGYVVAEAVNAILIKRASDAVRDGDPIRAIIRGTAVNSAGRTPGIAMPNSKAQATVIRGAYNNAGIPVSDLSQTGYVECHGTGTRAGDPVEAEGVASVFRQTRSPQDPLLIGSIKSNIGHSEAAAGLSSIIKVVLAIENGIIPGTATFEAPNPNIDLAALRLKVSRHALKWPSQSKLRASINSFGFGGANAHAILESSKYLVGVDLPRHKSVYLNNDDAYDFCDEAYSTSPSEPDLSPRLLLLSANDKTSLDSYVTLLSSCLLNPAVNVGLDDLAYTLSERRSRLYHRAFAVTTNTKITKNSFTFVERFSSPPRIGFVFTGQGAQWPTMGKRLLERFPTARDTIKRLDRALAQLPDPPSYSLLTELVDYRDPEILRAPELSQSLITALQLAFVSVLKTWGINPISVAGHSSGEIAAAVVAGYLSPEDAIVIAFLRGRAVAQAKRGPPLGMLAVGLSSDSATQFMDPTDDPIQIACLNSPRSVTVSGTVGALEGLQSRLRAANHFARLLQVDVAYHSDHMLPAGEAYENLLQANWQSIPWHENVPELVPMFSSVSGNLIEKNPGIAYWKRNLVSQVKFEEAIRCMIHSDDGANLLVEIGPSDTLSGPISHIIQDIPDSNPTVLYTSVSKRSKDTLTTIYNLPGIIFGLGGAVDVAAVNEYSAQETSPAVLVDLPSYAWNHSMKYWHESLASKDWRYRPFVKHDILGSKILGTTWYNPTWKNKLRLEDLPWLTDHRIGDQIVFPAAGYICMAIEALYQANYMTVWKEEPPAHYTFRLRDVEFTRALVLETSNEYTIMLSLSPVPHSMGSWQEFVVSSVKDDVWNRHASGLIRIEGGIYEFKSPADLTLPLKRPSTASSWYKSMQKVGLNYGASFRKLLEIECTVGHRISRSKVSLDTPPSTWPQSSYTLHPACMDACFQAITPTVWQGDRCDVSTAVVPRGIDSMILPFCVQQPHEAIAAARTEFSGVGRTELMKNYKSSCVVYHPETGGLILEMNGMRFSELDSIQTPSEAPAYTRITWDADLHFLTESNLRQIEHDVSYNFDDPAKRSGVVTRTFVNMAIHKNPNLKVLEFNLDSTDKSCLLDFYGPNSSQRPIFTRYHYYSDSPGTIAALEKRYGGAEWIEFIYHDFAMQFHSTGERFDLGIIRLPTHHTPCLSTILQHIWSCLQEFGTVYILTGNLGSENLRPELLQAGFNWTACLEVAELGQVRPDLQLTARREIKLAKFDENADYPSRVDLRELGWEVQYLNDALDIQKGDQVIIYDNFDASGTSVVDQRRWNMLQALVQAECAILWVTRGAQMQVSNPNGAISNGLARVVRNENPYLRSINLDVEHWSGSTTTRATDTCLRLLNRNVASDIKESEFVERGGILYISRLEPDVELNRAMEEDSADNLEYMDFHDSSRRIGLHADRIGSLESLQYHELAEKRSDILEDGCVEIKVVAAGVNFKDVALAVGLVPGDESRLGSEGSGIITRVAPNVTTIKPGQRVVFAEDGSFSNRIVTSAKMVCPIPDSLTFVEAATVPCVFMTAMHCLLNLAHMKADDRVLIHSAAGGVGLAAIQICHYVGAVVYATVGSQEKRDFLRTSYGIPDERIFSSRTRAFARQIIDHTGGKGVNIILNSLIGDLLDESWRIIADGGTMVEIGKKDILNNSSLSMEPFKRNASFCAFDLSHEEMNSDRKPIIISEIFNLLEKGLLKPIAPVHVFSFAEIPKALQYIGSGKHIGKLVISDSDTSGAQVSVRPHRPILKMREDASYLIIGGLRGLCASLALSLAKMGTKHLIVLSRSGHYDQRSQKAREDLQGCGCQVTFIKGDVTLIDDVRRACRANNGLLVRGIVQGAMVLRDRIFSSMTLEEFHGALDCKVKGTWNLHNVAIEQQLNLDFFTLLSSISGVHGQKGQANYGAANAFLDAFAAYRRGLGLVACSIDLGVIEDIGYLAENHELRERFDIDAWYGIDETLLRQIFNLSIRQQLPQPLSLASATQMITGIRVPQPTDSPLLSDPRFSRLSRHDTREEQRKVTEKSEDISAVLVAARSNADAKIILSLTTEVCSRYLAKSLRMSNELDVSRPLSVYGIDSLAAVEFRNFVKTNLGVDLSTLEILSATSLSAICEELIRRIRA
ncbi:reducing type I polyketide synthase [Hypoxylon sp. FL1857]|nr:reducing type I polyketide synthase [Hypoxylon sp. FL1857]